MSFQKWGGRRFLMCMGCAVINTWLFIAGTLTEGGYVTITLATVAAYITGNSVQRVLERGRNND